MSSSSSSSSKPRSATAAPVEDVQGDNRWMDQHSRFVSEAKEREPDVLFVGDSLIQHLSSANVWERSFAPLHCLNFGIGGDRTENVLWRLENGELDGGSLAPKAVVLMVGTNNHGDTAQDVADGVGAICRLIRQKQPQAYLIVLTLLPRGHTDNPLRARNAEANRLVGLHLRGDARAQLVNADPGFVQADGTISHHDMYDYLHLTQKGYDRAFEPVAELLAQVMAEAEGKGGGGGTAAAALAGVRTEAEGAAAD